MTIANTTRKAGPYDGNGATVTFPFAFKVFAASNLLVVLSDVGGVETTQTLTTDYTVTLNADQDDDPGGDVVMVTAPATGETLTLASQLPIEQPTELTNAGGFYPGVINNALDRITIVQQQEAEKLARALRTSISSPLTEADLPTPIPNYIIGWNADGTGFENYGPVDNTLLSAELEASGGSAMVGFIQAGAGASKRTVQAKLSETVSPLDSGAVGNGTTDDLAAVKKALESGFMVDGLGLTYGIDGTLTPTSLKGIYNAKFKQVGDRSASNSNTINLVGLSNFFLDNIDIDMGDDVETLFSDDGNSGLYIGGTAYNSFIENFTVSNVRVTGNGCGAGIHIRHAKNFTVDSCMVYDRISGSSPDPTNDSQNGIEFVNCNRFTVANSTVNSLRTQLVGVPTVRWTRGFLFAEAVDFTITGCSASYVDQGFDFSGGYEPATNYLGNRRFTISGCVANNCATFGFKFANATHNGLVSSCIANNTGSIGFVFSPAVWVSGIEPYLTQNIDVVGCKVVNTLGTGYSGSNSTGFRIMAGTGGSLTYPRGIRFKQCSVVDEQGVATTVGGFASDVALPEYPAAGYNTDCANIVLGCTVGDEVATPFSSLSPPQCLVTGAGTQAIPISTYTELNWDQDSSDHSYLHNPASNPQNIYIKTTGWYEVRAQIQFASNSAGYRIARLRKNGSVLDRSTVLLPPVNGNATSVLTSIPVYLVCGDYVSVEVFQNGGSPNLNVALNESSFNVTWIG